jgi:hypothetical protein
MGWVVAELWWKACECLWSQNPKHRTGNHVKSDPSDTYTRVDVRYS